MSGAGGVLALVTSAYVLANQFTGRGIDESVIYHARVGLGGAGFAEYIGVMVAAGVLAVLCLLYMWASLRASAYRVPRRMKREVALVVWPLLALAWGVNPGVENLSAMSRHYVLADTTSTRMPDFYRQLWELEAKSAPPRNLILIYAESLERGYFDEQRFPELLSNLSRLESSSLTFTELHPLPGMWWTIAGMVGSQCGVPLLTPPGQQNAEAITTSFLPGAHCLGDWLTQPDYRLAYLGGAESEFAGKGSFLLGHGFHEVEGKRQLEKFATDDADYNAWGIQDDILFEQVAKRARALQEGEKPFLLATINLGTHHPRGHMAASCQGRRYGDGDNPMLNAVHCTDYLLGQLIERLQAMPGAEQTLIAVVSDHTAMRNTASDLLEQGPRRNLMMVLGDDIAPRRVSRAGSQLDIGPTLLELMGFSVPALGLGRSLFQELPTFVEAHDAPDDALRALFPRLRTLWGVPTLEHGISYSDGQEQLSLGGKEWGIPLMLRLNDQADVTAVLGSAEELAALPENTDFVWVDDCLALGVESAPEAPVCIAWSGGPEQPLYWQRLRDSAPAWRWQLPDDAIDTLPPVAQLWPQLKAGGRLDSGSRLVAMPNPGHRFVHWQGVQGSRRFRPTLEDETADAGVSPQPVFDLAVEADGEAAAFRSAWTGVAQTGKGVLEEQLSPGGSRYSIARSSFLASGVGTLDLRAFGSYDVMRPQAFIRHEGNTLLEVTRGLGLVVLSPKAEVVHSESYDTHESPQASQALAETLAAIPPDHYILLASADDFTASATPELKQALHQLGFSVRFP